MASEQYMVAQCAASYQGHWTLDWDPCVITAERDDVYDVMIVENEDEVFFENVAKRHVLTKQAVKSLKFAASLEKSDNVCAMDSDNKWNEGIVVDKDDQDGGRVLIKFKKSAQPNEWLNIGASRLRQSSMVAKKSADAGIPAPRRRISSAAPAAPAASGAPAPAPGVLAIPAADAAPVAAVAPVADAAPVTDHGHDEMIVQLPSQPALKPVSVVQLSSQMALKLLDIKLLIAAMSSLQPVGPDQAALPNQTSDGIKEPTGWTSCGTTGRLACRFSFIAPQLTARLRHAGIAWLRGAHQHAQHAGQHQVRARPAAVAHQEAARVAAVRGGR